MARSKLLAALVLYPMSKLYGLGVGLRNLMFKWHVLRQREFPVPIIVVGNIGAGGTGKTPHTEYIVELLRFNHHIGVLSRGYRRNTTGFLLATRKTSPLQIGDEPFQLYRKFGRDVTVAVCEDRCRGIDEMLRLDPKIEMIVLDDAFQHRYVKPTVSVVLTEFDKPVFKDRLLPLGRLREPVSAIYRADMVVVTKCPPLVKPFDYRMFKQNLNLFPYQKLYFSSYEYGDLQPVFPDAPKPPHLSWLTEADTILALAGIGNPRPFVKYLRQFQAVVKCSIFPDHHYFRRSDFKAVMEKFDALPGERKLIITTEKDAVRLRNNAAFPDQLKPLVYVLPIAVKFDPHNDSSFDDDLRKALK